MNQKNPTSTNDDGLEDLSVMELRLRAGALHKIIEEAKTDGDERWKDLVPGLDRLRAVLSKKQTPVVVGMKTVELSANPVSPGREE